MAGTPALARVLDPAAMAEVVEFTDSTLPVTIGAFSTLAGAGAENISTLLATFEVEGTIGGMAEGGTEDVEVADTAGTAATATARA